MQLLAKAAAAAALISLLTWSPGVHAADSNGRVALTIPPNGGADCFYFSLYGVAQADPVLPGNSFFAMSKTDPAYQETFALVMTAAANGRYVYASTTGTVVCGKAKLAVVYTAWPSP